MLRKVVLALVFAGILSAFGIAQTDDGSVPWPGRADEGNVDYAPEPFAKKCDCMGPISPFGTTIKCREIARKVITIETYCDYTFNCSQFSWSNKPGLGTFRKYVYYITEECQEYLCFGCVNLLGGLINTCIWCPTPIGEPMYKFRTDYKTQFLGCGCYSKVPLPVKQDGEE